MMVIGGGPEDLLKPPEDPEASVHEADAIPDPTELSRAGLREARIDGAAISSKQDLMAALAEALELPDYFGGNWDALDEVLRDLGWLEARGHVLVVTGADDLRAREPDLIQGLETSWKWGAERWSADGAPFHLVLVR
jgi:hypothetical protein